MFKKRSREGLDTDVRFLLANERTLLAWVRTGLAVIAAGVAAAFLSTDQAFVGIAGVGAILIGGIMAILGYMRYIVADHAIREGKLPPEGKSELFIVIVVVCFSLVIAAAKIIGL